MDIFIGKFILLSMYFVSLIYRAVTPLKLGPPFPMAKSDVFFQLYVENSLLLDLHFDIKRLSLNQFYKAI